jgi:transposase
MQIEEFLSDEVVTKIKNLSSEEKDKLILLQQQSMKLLAQENEKLRKLANQPRQVELLLKDQLLIITNELFGSSSEKSKVEKDKKEPQKPKKQRAPPVLKPSLRYPDLPIVESRVEYPKGREPECSLCEADLKPMGVTEDSEYVTVTEKTYTIVRQKRAKYRCDKCHGDVKTAPNIPRIVKGGSFSDDIAIDVAVSKYADHLPVERYVNQAERAGLMGVSPQSLIEQTHFLADFLVPVYEAIRRAICKSLVLYADETRWKMLEGDITKNWQLWGFFDEKNSYLSATNTRAGQVAVDFLKDCFALYLMSDAFSGYKRAGTESKKKNCFCNAHARRKFKDSMVSFKGESEPVIEYYRKLYLIETEISKMSQEEKTKARQEKSKVIWNEMTTYIQNLNVLPKSSIGKAQSYFLNNYKELSLFLTDGIIPIDNNLAERGLRGPVVGRKNYFGNHSKRGARTTSILLSIIESCKLNHVNPKKYLKETVQMIHQGLTPLTPAEFASQTKAVA